MNSMKKRTEEPQTDMGSKVSEKRKRLFRVIAIAFPFFILFIIEMSLRLFQYGDDLNLFIEAKDRPDFLVLNPAASKRYFVNMAFAPTGNSELFRKNKDKTTLRLFVLGESTTIGYPYFHNGSFHRWLLYRLMHEFPDRNFEVINLSLTGVNSYTVLGFAKELVKYQPDAVLIYSGHNEYYGTLGVASTNSIGNHSGLIKLLLAIRQLRIVQLLSNLIQKVKPSVSVSPDHHSQTLMQAMVADQQIAFGSEMYKKGIDQFISNTDEALGLFQKHGIPVFISDLVSNESDLKPFVSIMPDSIKLGGFKVKYAAGVKAFQSRDTLLATQLLLEANAIYEGHALCNYYLGELAFCKANYGQAKTYFVRARDLDGLRFRAPTAINDAIIRLSGKYPMAHLVNTQAAFDSISPHHIVGKELMLEHVHPNLTGYAIISNSFYEALKSAHIISEAPGHPMNFDQLIRSMPVTTIDSLLGVFRISKLKQHWPFNEALARDSPVVQSEEEKLAYSVINEKRNWASALDELYNYYFNRKELAQSKTIMESMVLEHPTESFFYDKTANFCGKLGDMEDAAFYFKKAFAMAPGFQYARTLFVIYLTIDKPAEAMPFLDYAIQHNSSNLNFLPVRKYAGEIIQLKKEFSKDSTNTALIKLIATSYMNMGNKEGASKYAEKLLKVDPGNKEALALLGQIKKG